MQKPPNESYNLNIIYKDGKAGRLTRKKFRIIVSDNLK